MRANYMRVYAIVSTIVKNECIREERVRLVNSIDPVTGSYETEKYIMNCFPSLDTAVRVLKRLGTSRRMDIIGYGIPTDSFLWEEPRVAFTERKDIKRNTSEWCYRKCGLRNYKSTFRHKGIDYEYIVMADISCIEEVFDPGVKNRRINSFGFYAPNTTPDAGNMQASSPVRTAQPSVPVRMENRQDSGKKTGMGLEQKGTNEIEIHVSVLLAALAGIALGFYMGVTVCKYTTEYPVLDKLAVVLLVILVTAGILLYKKLKKALEFLWGTLMGK